MKKPNPKRAAMQSRTDARRRKRDLLAKLPFPLARAAIAQLRRPTPPPYPFGIPEALSNAMLGKKMSGLQR